MTKFRTGLIVGKFCPLHKGHEFLIETAQKASERLVLISYSKPEYHGCEAEKRRLWLSDLYPNTKCIVVDDVWLAENAPSVEFSTVPDNETDEHFHRRFTAWLAHNVLGETIDAIFTSEDYGDGFARVMSAYQSAPVKHVCVDMERAAVPISGTLIRENFIQHREFLSDIVYASFVKKAVFLGGESTGKSTLARAVAESMNTQFVPEYGRTLWEQKEGSLNKEDMLKIGRTQYKQEENYAARAGDWLLCDTSPLTTVFYSQYMFGHVDPELETLSQTNYHLTFLCAPDFEFVQDGTRRGSKFRQKQHQWYVKNLQERQIQYVLLTGTIEARLENVLQEIQTFEDR